MSYIAPLKGRPRIAPALVVKWSVRQPSPFAAPLAFPVSSHLRLVQVVEFAEQEKPSSGGSAAHN